MHQLLRRPEPRQRRLEARQRRKSSTICHSEKVPASNLREKRENMSPQVRALPDKLLLLFGKHDGLGGRMCIMEATAFVAGEAWTDHPACASPHCAEYARRINDAGWSSDTARTAALLPPVPLLAHRKADHLELRR